MYVVFILFKNLLSLYSLIYIFVVFAGEIRDYIYITLLKVDYCFINWSCGKVRKCCVYRGAVFYLVLRGLNYFISALVPLFSSYLDFTPAPTSGCGPVLFTTGYFKK